MADDNFGFIPDEDDNQFGFQAEQSPQPEVGMGEALLKGAEQGLTFGFADELGGAMGAGLEGITEAVKTGSLKPVSDQNLIKLYEEYKQAARQRYKQAEEARPQATLVGQLAGGILVPGGAIKGAKTLTTAQKMKAGAALGSGLGAIGGAGVSEAPVTSPEFAKDVATGTATGLGVGGLAPAALPVARKVGKELLGGAKWTAGKILGPIDEAARMGWQGIKATTDEGIKAVKKQIGEFAGKVAPEIQNDLRDLAIQKNRLIKEAEKAGVRINISEIDDIIERRLAEDPQTDLKQVLREMEEFKEIIRSSKEGRLVRKEIREEIPTSTEKFRWVEELKKAEQNAIDSGVDPADIETVYEDVDVPGQVAGIVRQAIRVLDPETNEYKITGYKKLASRLLNVDDIPEYRTRTQQVREGGRDLSEPQRLYQLYKDLKQKTKFGDSSFQSDEAKKAAGELTGKISESLKESVPGIRQTDEGIAAYKRAAEALGIPDTQNINEKQIRDRIISIIGQEGKVGVGGIKAQETVDLFLKELSQANPEMAARLAKDFQKYGTQVGTIQEINKPLSLLSLASPLSITRTLGSGAANLGGYYAGKTAQAASKIGASGVASIKKYTPDILRQKADQLNQLATPSAKKVAEVLVRAADADERARNAILFGLLQNPAYRQYFKDEEEAK